MPTDPMLETLRARLGAQYAIEGLLGRGGMGSVFRARDLTLDRPVAIKVVTGDVATNPELRARFLQEARTVAKLRHPNIVAVYSAGDADGMLYFAMELVPGESLRDLLDREKRVDGARAERILHELALALDYAHANGIVHRDVKPENILLDRETGRAMLTDFGVARALEGDGRMTGTGMILGSPRYMSPEQATGETTIDGRSDLYALALVGYEMFTGKPVVDAGNVAAMLVKHLTETPKPISDAVPAIPEGVATAIDRALLKDRDQRWANGREMAEVIGMAWTPMGGSSGIGTRAAAPPAARGGFAIPREPAARRRALLVTAVSLASLAITFVAVLWPRGGAPRDVDPRRSYAVMPFEIQSGNRDVQWLRDGSVNMLTLALSQWSDLTVADYERTMVLVREAGLEDKRVDIDRALAIARKAGAWTVVTGTIATTSDSLLVDARLYDVGSGKSLQTEHRAVALTADPRPLFDGLARYLLGVAGGTATETVDLAAATTKSITAYRAYLEGTRALFSWQVLKADTLFQRAIAADSTFALAWHKRSLALGWGDAGGPGYLESSERALALVDRLPAREQALVRGHHALSMGLRAQTANTGNGAKELREAQQIFSDLIARDSSVAEAWYGLADARFHTQFDAGDMEGSLDRMTGALRAFERTLALDSTFHLAYSHLVSMYAGMSTANSEIFFDGTRIQPGDSASIRRAGGPDPVARMRTEAGRTGLRLSRLWARADTNAIAPRIALAQGFIAAGMTDSAIVVVDQTLAEPQFAAPQYALWGNQYRFVADDPRGAPGLVEGTRALDVARFRQIPFTDRYGYLAMAISAAGAIGSGAEVDRVSGLWARIDTVAPFIGGPMAPAMQWFATSVHIAMTGEMSAAQRGWLLDGLRPMSDLPANSPVRFGAIPVAYVAYLVSRDTIFSGLVRRINPQPVVTWPELDAREALERGDTTRARAIAATFSPAARVATARLGLAGLRTALRAEVLADLGDAAGAVAQYEAMHPSRFATSLIDPGHAVYVRTFAARARLYEQLGEREKAIAAWTEFLRRWEKGDAETEAARREARAALQRLRDQPTTRRP